MVISIFLLFSYSFDNINILKQEYLSLFLDDFAEIMEYKPSNQFVSDSLKKTENPRLISP